MKTASVFVYIELPSGFIDCYGFESVSDLINFEADNSDCKFGPIMDYNPLDIKE